MVIIVLEASTHGPYAARRKGVAKVGYGATADVAANSAVCRKGQDFRPALQAAIAATLMRVKITTLAFVCPAHVA